MDDDTKYTPGVRMYFKTKDLYELNKLCHDGIHIKVLNVLPLQYVKHIVVNNRDIFYDYMSSINQQIKKTYLDKLIFVEPKDTWTLKSFVSAANKLVKNHIDY